MIVFSILKGTSHSKNHYILFPSKYVVSMSLQYFTIANIRHLQWTCVCFLGLYVHQETKETLKCICHEPKGLIIR